jgi:hypothetical protein
MGMVAACVCMPSMLELLSDYVIMSTGPRHGLVAIRRRRPSPLSHVSASFQHQGT